MWQVVVQSCAKIGVPNIYLVHKGWPRRWEESAAKMEQKIKALVSWPNAYL